MKLKIFALGAAAIAVVSVGCVTRPSMESKAEEYRRSGVAQDMGEAIKMAEQNHWPEGLRRAERQAQEEREASMLRKKG